MAILRASVFKQMGIYKGLLLFLDEVLTEIKALNKHEYYFRGSILKIAVLEKLGMRDEAFTIIDELEAVIDKHKQISSKDRLEIQGSLKYFRGSLNWTKGDLDKAVESLHESLELQKRAGNRESIGNILNRIGAVEFFKGKLDSALDYFKQNLGIQTGLMNKMEMATGFNNIGEVYYLKGEYELALECYENALTLDEEIDYRWGMAHVCSNIGSTCRSLDKNDKALAMFERSLGYCREVENDYFYSYGLSRIIEFLLEVRFKEKEPMPYLKELEELAKGTDSDVVRVFYNISKSLVLKNSTRLANKVQAQTIFKGITEEKVVVHDITVKALLNLAELQLLELKVSGDEEILLELNTTVQQLISIGNDQNSPPILIKTYILQSKLALLNFDLETSRSMLEKARNLAEIKNIRKLSMIILEEQNILAEKSKEWQNMIKRKGSFKERVELARVEDTLSKIIKNKLEVVDGLDDIITNFNVSDISFIVSRFGIYGADVFKTIGLPEGKSFEKHAPQIAVTSMTVLGQGGHYHEGLFGPFPVPVKGYSSLVYSIILKDKAQQDERLKGKTYCLFCLVLPQEYAVLFYDRVTLSRVFDKELKKIEDIEQVDDQFLKSLRENIHHHVTDLFKFNAQAFDITSTKLQNI